MKGPKTFKRTSRWNVISLASQECRNEQEPRCCLYQTRRGRVEDRFDQHLRHSFHTGQTPTLRYNRQLMQAIWHDRLPIADIVNAEVISLEEAPKGYADFDKGAAVKFPYDQGA